MKTRIKKRHDIDQIEKPVISDSESGSKENAPYTGGSSRREFLQKVGLLSGGAAVAMMMNMTPGVARAADLTPDFTPTDNPYATGRDYSKIPQRLHKYPASERARKIVHKSMTMDTLFSGTWPEQWSSRDAPEFHDEMARCKAAGFKVLALCPSADALSNDIKPFVNALQFYIKKLSERPDKYKIVRTTKDIDEAIKEKKLGVFFTHQGTALFGGDVDRVGLWRQLGYGYCLLAYNQRNNVGDGCFVKDDRGLTAYGKALVDAYNRYGMLVDVSHCGERTSLDAIERSRDPVISSHSVAMAIAKYPRSLEDSVIKAVAKSGGVCSINMVGAFVDMTNPDIVTTDVVFRHVDYMANLVGIDHVGFGSDYIPDITFTADGLQTPVGAAIFPDGGYSAKMGEKGVPTPAPYQIVAALVDKMLENGYSEKDCGKFLGGNMYRVMDKVWK